MKVKNLIKTLSQYDPEMDVVLHEFNGEPVMFVASTQTFPNIVRLQTESDVNMKEELLERFKLIEQPEEDKSLYLQMDVFKFLKGKRNLELAVYESNIFQGITPDVIEKYLDKDHADMMREFCKKNKLEY